jgi:hypothetical protein
VYAYLLSTLPSFTLGDPPPMTVETLLEHCRPFLGEDELRALEDPPGSGDAPGEAGSVARRWSDGERQLRNAVARRRAAGWGVTPEPYLHEHEGFRVDVEDGVTRAFEATTPLERERLLHELRWRLLDDLAGVVPWGFAALFAYAQRLRDGAVWAERDVDEGRRVLQATLERLEQRYEASVPPEAHDA